MFLMIVYNLLEILKWLIIARAVVSWFVPPTSNHPLMQLLRKATDPILRPISELVPPMGGVDVSPLIAFFAVYLTQMALLRIG